MNKDQKVFAWVIVGAAVLIGVLLFTVPIPEGNKSYIDMALGVLGTGGIASIYKMLFGNDNKAG